MRRFFIRNKKIRNILIIAFVLVMCIGVFGYSTNWSYPVSSITGAVINPIQKLFSNIGDDISSIFISNKEKQELVEENKKLEEKISDLTFKLVDYEKVKRENEFNKEFLEIKSNHKDYKMCDANVIARNTSNHYGSFTINQGTAKGIREHDPVITSPGVVVGYIAKASATQSVVVSILDPTLKISALVNRTSDTGTISGDSMLAANNQCVMSYLKRDNQASAGDYVVTSGEGGIFPGGLIIGTIKEIKQNTNEIDIYAIVEPMIDFHKIQDVMVITEFSGQSSILK